MEAIKQPAALQRPQGKVSCLSCGPSFLSRVKTAKACATKKIQGVLMSLGFICVLNQIFIDIPSVRADDNSRGCALGPYYSQSTFGAKDRGDCLTWIDVMETDTCSSVFIGGGTYSYDLGYGFSSRECSKFPFGYFAKFEGENLKWKYIFDGEPPYNLFQFIEYIGIGEVQDYENAVNTKYPNKQSAVLMRTTNDRFLMFFDDTPKIIKAFKVSQVFTKPLSGQMHQTGITFLDTAAGQFSLVYPRINTDTNRQFKVHVFSNLSQLKTIESNVGGPIFQYGASSSIFIKDTWYIGGSIGDQASGLQPMIGIFDGNFQFKSGYKWNRGTTTFSIDYFHSSRYNKGIATYTVTGIAQERNPANFALVKSFKIMLCVFRESGHPQIGSAFFSVQMVTFFPKETWFIIDSTEGKNGLNLQGREFDSEADLQSNLKGSYFATQIMQWNCITQKASRDAFDTGSTTTTSSSKGKSTTTTTTVTEDQYKTKEYNNQCADKQDHVKTKYFEPECMDQPVCRFSPVPKREDLYSKFPIFGITTNKYDRTVLSLSNSAVILVQPKFKNQRAIKDALDLQATGSGDVVQITATMTTTTGTPVDLTASVAKDTPAVVSYPFIAKGSSLADAQQVYKVQDFFQMTYNSEMPTYFKIQKEDLGINPLGKFNELITDLPGYTFGWKTQFTELKLQVNDPTKGDKQSFHISARNSISRGISKLQAIKVVCDENADASVRLTQTTLLKTFPLGAQPEDSIVDFYGIFEFSSKIIGCGFDGYWISSDIGKIATYPVEGQSYCSLAPNMCTKIQVKTNVEGSYQIKVNANINSRPQNSNVMTDSISNLAQQTLTITVFVGAAGGCGSETVTAPASLEYLKLQTTGFTSLEPLLPLFNSSDSKCPVAKYTLYDTVIPLVPSTDTQTKILSNQLQFMHDNVTEKSLFVVGETSSLKSAQVQLKYAVCNPDSLVPSADTIKKVFYKGKFEMILYSELLNMFKVQNCSMCSNYELDVLNAGMYITFDAQQNMVVITQVPQTISFTLQTNYKTKPICNQLNQKSLEVVFKICGLEYMYVYSYYPLNYTVKVGEDFQAIKIPKTFLVEQFFVSDPDCPAEFMISNTPAGPMDLSSVVWGSWVKYDGVFLTIDHAGHYTQDTDYSIQIFVRAVTKGGVMAYKEIKVNFKYNSAPYFTTNLVPVYVSITQSMLDGSVPASMFVFDSPQVKDREGNQAIFNFTLSPQINCNCLTAIDNGNGTFTMQVDRSKITQADIGTYYLKILTSDSTSSASNSYMMTVPITYFNDKQVSTTTVDSASQTTGRNNQGFFVPIYYDSSLSGGGSTNQQTTTTTNSSTSTSSATNLTSGSTTTQMSGSSTALGGTSTTISSGTASGSTSGSTQGTTTGSTSGTSSESTSGSTSGSTSTTSGGFDGFLQGDLSSTSSQNTTSSGQITTGTSSNSSLNESSPFLNSTSVDEALVKDLFSNQTYIDIANREQTIANQTGGTDNPGINWNQIVQNEAGEDEVQVNLVDLTTIITDEDIEISNLGDDDDGDDGDDFGGDTFQEIIENYPAIGPSGNEQYTETIEKPLVNYIPDFEKLLNRSKTLNDSKAFNGEQGQFKLKIGDISRDGKVKIQSNGKMDISKWVTEEKRKLISVDKVSVSSEVFDSWFIIRSNVDPSKIQYGLFMTAWDDFQIELQFDFLNPELISRGVEQDVLVMRIKDPMMFMSTEQNLAPQKGYTFRKEFPAQLPKNVSEADSLLLAQNIKAGLESVFIGEFVITQVMFDGVLYEFWTLFYTLQLLCYITFYNVAMPAIAELFIQNLTKIIEFDFINIETIVKKFKPDFDLNKMLGIDDVQSVKVANRLRFIIILVTQIFIVQILIKIIRCFLPCLNRCLGKPKSLKEQMIWNGFIRINTVAYIVYCMVFGYEIQRYFFRTKKMVTVDLIIGSVFSSVIVLIPLFIAIFLWRNRNILHQEKMRQKYEVLYEGISLKKTKNKIWYWPVFMFRRIVFILLPLVLRKYPYFQLQLLTFLTLLYIMFYANLRPHQSKTRFFLELFNESCMTLANYHLICVSEFNLYKDTFHPMGVSYIVLIGVVITVNIVLVLRQKIQNCIRMRRLKGLRDDALKEQSLLRYFNSIGEMRKRAKYIDDIDQKVLLYPPENNSKYQSDQKKLIDDESDEEKGSQRTNRSSKLSSCEHQPSSEDKNKVLQSKWQSNSRLSLASSNNEHKSLLQDLRADILEQEVTWEELVMLPEQRHSPPRKSSAMKPSTLVMPISVKGMDVIMEEDLEDQSPWLKQKYHLGQARNTQTPFEKVDDINEESRFESESDKGVFSRSKAQRRDMDEKMIANVRPDMLQNRMLKSLDDRKKGPQVIQTGMMKLVHIEPEEDDDSDSGKNSVLDDMNFVGLISEITPRDNQSFKSPSQVTSPPKVSKFNDSESSSSPNRQSPPVHARKNNNRRKNSMTMSTKKNSLSEDRKKKFRERVNSQSQLPDLEMAKLESGPIELNDDIESMASQLDLLFEENVLIETDKAHMAVSDIKVQFGQLAKQIEDLIGKISRVNQEVNKVRNLSNMDPEVNMNIKVMVTDKLDLVNRDVHSLYLKDKTKIDQKKQITKDMNQIVRKYNDNAQLVSKIQGGENKDLLAKYHETNEQIVKEVEGVAANVSKAKTQARNLDSQLDDLLAKLSAIESTLNDKNQVSMKLLEKYKQVQEKMRPLVEKAEQDIEEFDRILGQIALHIECSLSQESQNELIAKRNEIEAGKMQLFQLKQEFQKDLVKIEDRVNAVIRKDQAVKVSAVMDLLDDTDEKYDRHSRDQVGKQIQQINKEGRSAVSSAYNSFVKDVKTTLKDSKKAQKALKDQSISTKAKVKVLQNRINDILKNEDVSDPQIYSQLRAIEEQTKLLTTNVERQIQDVGSLNSTIENAKNLLNSVIQSKTREDSELRAIKNSISSSQELLSQCKQRLPQIEKVDEKLEKELDEFVDQLVKFNNIKKKVNQYQANVIVAEGLLKEVKQMTKNCPKAANGIIESCKEMLLDSEEKSADYFEEKQIIKDVLKKVQQCNHELDLAVNTVNSVAKFVKQYGKQIEDQEAMEKLQEMLDNLENACDIIKKSESVIQDAKATLGDFWIAVNISHRQKEIQTLKNQVEAATKEFKLLKKSIGKGSQSDEVKSLVHKIEDQVSQLTAEFEEQSHNQKVIEQLPTEQFSNTDINTHIIEKIRQHRLRISSSQDLIGEIQSQMENLQEVALKANEQNAVEVLVTKQENLRERLRASRQACDKASQAIQEMDGNTSGGEDVKCLEGSQKLLPSAMDTIEALSTKLVSIDPTTDFETSKVQLQKLSKQVEKLEKTVQAIEIEVIELNVKQKLIRRDDEIELMSAAANAVEYQAQREVKQIMQDLNEQQAKIQSGTASDKVKKDVKSLQKYLQELNEFTLTVEPLMESNGQLLKEFDGVVPEFVKQQRAIRNNPEGVVEKQGVQKSGKEPSSVYEQLSLSCRFRPRIKQQAALVLKVVKEFDNLINKYLKIKLSLEKDVKVTYNAVSGDPIDKLFGEAIVKRGCTVQVTRLKPGNYIFGSKQVLGKIVNDKLMIRINGAFMPVNDFITQNGWTEQAKLNYFGEEESDPYLKKLGSMDFLKQIERKLGRVADKKQ